MDLYSSSDHLHVILDLSLRILKELVLIAKQVYQIKFKVVKKVLTEIYQK